MSCNAWIRWASAGENKFLNINTLSSVAQATSLKHSKGQDYFHRLSPEVPAVPINHSQLYCLICMTLLIHLQVTLHNNSQTGAPLGLKRLVGSEL